MSYETELLERLYRRTTVDLLTGCWVFGGSLNLAGYGEISVLGRKRRTHRVTYELLVGPIPEGLQIDHLCRNRACCNPAHLEPVTNAENGRRGIAADVTRARMLARTHCKQGHEYTPENTQYTQRQRRCRACNVDASTRYASKYPDKVKEFEERRKVRRGGGKCQACAGPKSPGRGLRYCDHCHQTLGIPDVRRRVNADS